MKYSLLVAFSLPFLVSGQVKMNELITKRGLTYDMAGRAPLTGQAYTLFPTGDTQTVVTYKDGILDGEVVSMFAKDRKQVEGVFDKGQKVGVWKFYFESGKIKRQTTYSNNIENGPQTIWYENGQKQQEGFFSAGSQDSTWSEWYENGKPKMIGHFTNLERNGDWTYWDEQGNITVKKNYQHGLVIVAKDNLDTYVEKMEYYIGKQNYKEALKNVEAAEATLATKTDTSELYMGLLVYHSKCYSLFFHNREAERVLLDGLGLTPIQEQVIQDSHLDKSPAKINQLISEINQKEQSGFKATNHIVLAVCYDILGDSANFQQQQQIAMLKGGMKEYIINISLQLYKLAEARSDNYRALQEVDGRIKSGGATEQLELEKAKYLIRNEKFEEAQKIIDKYLQKDAKNVTVLLLKADLETALGNVDKRKLYEDKALVIDPNALAAGNQ